MAALALPAPRAWRNGTMDDDITQNTYACMVVAIFIVIVPWDYVWRNFVAAKSERWS